ncbi:zinc finger CCCH domain-containing protein 3 isoform X2 [Narcine bancroftii]|uniref:zinc finger CCCH domain-containing protein 3 isoform X2 n=1 Tax=Narcine bancroftii TaxID=1343680 RepID=UPI0038317A8D
MEERAALERQIRLLSALITNHKNVHGDVPAVTGCGAHWQGSWTNGNPKSSSVYSQKVSQHHRPESSSSWRSKYSLVNKKPVNTACQASNLSQAHIVPTQACEQNTVGKCMEKATVTEGGNLISKSNKKLRATPKAQSLLDLNSELEVKNNKLLKLKEKLDKVKMTRNLNGINGAKSISCTGPTMKSVSKQEEERRTQNPERTAQTKAIVTIKESALNKCHNVLVRCPTKTQCVESSSISNNEALIHKLQKLYEKEKDHSIADKTAQGAGKFQHAIEPSDGVCTTPGVSSNLHRVTVMNKIAELDEYSKNDCIKFRKNQNASRFLDQILHHNSPIKNSKYTWQKGPDLDMGTTLHRCQNEALKTGKERVSPCTSQVQMNVVSDSLKSKTPLSLKVLRKQKTSTPLRNSVGKGRKAKYVWISNAAPLNQPMRSSEITKKSISPKLVKSTIKRALGGNSTTLSLDPGIRSAGKQKKTGSNQKIDALSNKYSWKAVQAVSPSKSLYQWKSQDSYKARSSGHQMKTISLKRDEFAIDVPKKTLNEYASSHYKMKSTTKIIRRNGRLSSPTEKKFNVGNLPVMKSRYLLVKKNTVHGKSIPFLKRTQGKGLVQISKHRLQRLTTSGSHGSAKQGVSSSFSGKNSSSNRLINTRYKIVKKNASWNSSLSAASCGISSKTKKVNSSCLRSHLLNRARQSSNYRFLQQRWKTKGMRCIGGVLYRVSANKLAKSSSDPLKTRVTSTKGAVKSVRSDTHYDLYLPSSLTKAFTHRHIASRAVQRSLAIIRHAKQKKSKKKEYCMYYNRFGKCNRGGNCPYIHDPEKVAVCTRFLRGTCKKIDGTCPFSHKVSKDKMPVCSYYLKGICNSNNCPYSHVYVSRKAEVCQDFLKGYCPLGAKCKKKHTLICPEFFRTGNCTQGSKCKLQHRQQKSHRQKQASEASQDGAANEGTVSKQIRLANNTERSKERMSKQMNSVDRMVSSFASNEFNGSSSSQHWLPAFIALHSSVSSEEKVDSEVEEEREGEAMEHVCPGCNFPGVAEVRRPAAVRHPQAVAPEKSAQKAGKARS